MAASNGSEFFELEVQGGPDSFARPSNVEVARDDNELLWAAVERLPSVKKLNAAVLRRTASELGRSDSEGGVIETLDVRKLDRSQRELLVQKALATSEQDNIKLLSGIKQRLGRSFSILSLSLCSSWIRSILFSVTDHECAMRFVSFSIWLLLS